MIENLETACRGNRVCRESGVRERIPCKFICDSLAVECLAGDQMRPPEQRETGKPDLFRSPLNQIIDLKHRLVALHGGLVFWSGLHG